MSHNQTNYRHPNVPMEVIEELNELETDHYECLFFRDRQGAEHILMQLRQFLKTLEDKGWDIGRFEFYKAKAT